MVATFWSLTLLTWVLRSDSPDHSSIPLLYLLHHLTLLLLDHHPRPILHISTPPCSITLTSCIGWPRGFLTYAEFRASPCLHDQFSLVPLLPLDQQHPTMMKLILMLLMMTPPLTRWTIDHLSLLIPWISTYLINQESSSISFMVFLKLFIFLVIEDNAMDSVGELCLMFIYESVKNVAL